MGKEGEREERKDGWKKEKKGGRSICFFPPPVAGDLQYSWTPMESKTDKKIRKKEGRKERKIFGREVRRRHS